MRQSDLTLPNSKNIEWNKTQRALSEVKREYLSLKAKDDEFRKEHQKIINSSFSETAKVIRSVLEKAKLFRDNDFREFCPELKWVYSPVDLSIYRERSKPFHIHVSYNTGNGIKRIPKNYYIGSDRDIATEVRKKIKEYYKVRANTETAENTKNIEAAKKHASENQKFTKKNNKLQPENFTQRNSSLYGLGALQSLIKGDL